MLELLSTNEAHEEILEVYEKAALIEPYDETLHLYSLQALIGLGETKSALNHYNYITSFLYKELGVKPSAPYGHYIGSCNERCKITTKPT